MTDYSAGNTGDKRPVVTFLEVTDAHAGQRIDNFLLRHLKGVPKSRVYRILRKGEVRVNKSRVKAEYRLCDGDLLRIPPVRISDAKPSESVSVSLSRLLSNSILYEDDRLLIINKPSGLAVHGGSGISQGLIEALRVLRPEARFLELVHRLDRDTSGCVMIAKKRSMLRHLHEQLRSGKIDKRYLALVSGRWPQKRRVVNEPLLKNSLQSGERMVNVAAEGKKSITEFSVVERYAQATLVEAKPITGRTHQIRVHAQYAGCPLLGDDKYGNPAACRDFKKRGLRRLFLHAASLKVPLPPSDLADAPEFLMVRADLDAELSSFLAGLARE